jgi:sterol desaturase/sphingolipid hydroxylase (fatty acid hydroxylase superfamily)
MAEFQQVLADFTYDTGFFVSTLLLAGAACFFLERLSPAEPQTKFFKRDFKKELGLALLNAIIFVPILTYIVTISVVALLRTVAPFQMFDETIQQWPIAVQVVAGLLILDFSTYWRHRFTHNYMWPYHSFHHSAEEITWITSLRLHPIDMFAAVLFDTMVLYFLGFTGIGIIGAALIMQFYNYYTHLNINIRYGKPLCYILASPHYHRWHHATDKSAYDKNFCAMFSFYDVIFGTYYHPDDLPKAYGLTPREQQEVPHGLIAHILHPIKKDFKKIFRR